MNTNDPIELIVAEGLTRAHIPFVHESDNKEQSLDFYLPIHDILIEVKQFASERIADQLAPHGNVILIQGRRAAQCFAGMINGL